MQVWRAELYFLCRKDVLLKMGNMMVKNDAVLSKKFYKTVYFETTGFNQPFSIKQDSKE